MNNKKKITFILSSLSLTGIEKVCIRMLKEIDLQKYDVNLLLMHSGGELDSELPKDIKVMYCHVAPLRDEIKKFHLCNVVRGVFYRILIRLSNSNEKENYYTSKLMCIPNGISESCIICFTHDFLCMSVSKRCNSTHKFLWIHTDQFEKIIRDEKLYYSIISSFDHYYCVSKAAKDVFDKKFKDLSERSSVFYNFIDKEEIMRLANAFSPCMKSISILTIGRLCSQKNQIIIPEIVRKLLDNDYNIYWYLIGEGDCREKIEELIKKYSIEDHLILIGMKKNPFPYLKYCDIYVQPSTCEAYCTTTNEARVLCKPIIASNIPPMHEQFVNMENGLLVDNTVDDYYVTIRYLIDHPQIGESFSRELSKITFDYKYQLENFYLRWL